MSTQQGFTTSNGQTFTPGVQGFSNAAAPAKQDPNVVSVHAPRWMFNPFAYINIADRPISGHQQLLSGVFLPIEDQQNRVSMSGMDVRGRPVGKGAANAPGSLADSGGQIIGVATPQINTGTDVVLEIRTAFAIADELENQYSDRGLRALPSLTGVRDVELIKTLHAALVAPGLEYRDDPYVTDFPVPNLPKLEEYLNGEGRRQATSFQGDMTVKPLDVINDLLVSIRTALQTCRSTTREAQRVIANRTVGHVHAFDAWQSRCFLALGLDVPSDLPTLQGGGNTPAAVSSDNGELARLRSENENLKAEKYENEIAMLRAENEALKDRPITTELTAASGDDNAVTRTSNNAVETIQEENKNVNGKNNGKNNVGKDGK